MASAAEQMAANLSWGTFGKAKDLQSRIVFALALLIVYRIGTYIPVPGVDAVRLAQFFEQQSAGLGGMLNMFTGGAVGRMAIFALGIMPYISASIIVQLLASMVPSLQALKKEGESGRKKINQYTRYGTVFLATFQAYGLSLGLEAEGMALDPGWFFRLGVVVTLVGGTMFLMWIGEQITARGIGNGISLIIFVGIVAGLPGALAQFFTQGRTGAISPAVIVGILIMAVAVIAFVVFMERALRKIHIQYPKRQVGMKVYGGESSNLPIKVNPAGVIPAIFASSLLLLPATITTFSGARRSDPPVQELPRRLHGPRPAAAPAVLRRADRVLHLLLHRQRRLQVRRRRRQPQAPGRLRPRHPAGPEDHRVPRLCRHPHPRLGSAYLAVVCLLPEVLISQLSIPFYFGGTSLLIVVSVTMDTITQVQSHLLAHQYEGLIEKSRLRGKGRGKPRR